MDTKEFLEIFEKAEKEEFKKKEKRSFADLTLSKQAIFAIVLLVLFFVSSTYFILSFQADESKTTKKTPPSSVKTPPNIFPTPSKVTLDGTITCLTPSIPSTKNICDIGIKTKDGFYYKIPNISKSELEVGTYTIGKNIKAEGILDSPKISQNGSSLTGINIAGSFYIVPNQAEQSGLTPGGINTSITPTVKTTLTNTPISTPTPTPAPTITPTPSPTPILASPGSVRYILENSQALNGTIVSVSAYLIDGYIGPGACDFIDPCDHWVLTIADNDSDDLTNNYWVNVNINQSEKEENYTAGTIVSLRGTVIVNPNSVILEKVY